MVKLKIREVAEAQGVENAAQLSRRADIAQSAAYNLWNGVTTDPGILTLAAIARALKVKISDLFEESDSGTMGNHMARAALAV